MQSIATIETELGVDETLRAYRRRIDAGHAPQGIRYRLSRALGRRRAAQ